MTSSRPVVYDLSDFEDVGLSRFQYALCSYSGSVLAIATSTFLILTNDTSSCTNSGYHGEDYSTVRLIIDFNEDAGRPSCIQWIIEAEVVAVGFDSGLVVCFNCKGEEIWKFKGASSPVQSIKVASTAVHKMGAAMWLLYEEGLLVSFPVGQVLDDNITNMATYRLSNHKLSNDFAFYPHIYKSSIFDGDDVLLNPPSATNSGGSKSGTSSTTSSAVKKGKNSGPESTPHALLSVFTVGLEASMAVYNLGGVVFSTDSERTANVRESAVNILSKGVMSLYNWYGGGGSSSSGGGSGGDGHGNGAEKKSDTQKVADSTLMVAAKVEFRDPKRRVLKLSADPLGRYMAAADSLGRVLLFDTTLCAVVRIWKGLRHAELAWTTREPPQPAPQAPSPPPTSAGAGAAAAGAPALSLQLPPLPPPPPGPAPAVPTICLVIHAPLLGLVYVYPMSHGPCVRIIPVGLNCHIFTMTAPGKGHGDHHEGDEVVRPDVRAYLLQPIPERTSIELSEIQPADHASTDLDVRLTLVGEDAPSEDGEEGYMVGEGEGGGSDDEGERGGGDGGGDVTDRLGGATLDAPHSGDRERRPSITRRLINPASSSASESNALRNIEGSLQLLVDAMPHAALRQAAQAHPSTPARPLPSSQAMSAELFALAVERAEESVLELLTAHKMVLGMNSLYKCLCMIESVELYGELTPPPYAHSDQRADADGAVVQYLSYALGLCGNAGGAALQQQWSGARLGRTGSSNSILSLVSDVSAPTPVPSSPHGLTRAVSKGGGTGASGSGGAALFAALLRYPAFSAHLHKTVITMLMEAINAHEQGGHHKYQYDVNKGEVTHLPAHILLHLKQELPQRLRCLSAYTAFQELGAAADKARADAAQQYGAFNALQTLNLRQMFDRSAPPATTSSSTSVVGGSSQYSMLGSLSPLSGLGHSPSPSMAAAPSALGGGTGDAITGRRTLDDEVTALCKLTTPRGEAAMWALRAAQNAELQAAREAALAAAAAVGSAKHQASASDGEGRLVSADSGGSTLSRAAQLLGSIAVRPSVLTPTGSAESFAHSHSKVRRVGGRDAVSTPPSHPSHSVDRSDPGAVVPFFPTEYSKREPRGGVMRSPNRSRSGSQGSGHQLSECGEETHRLNFSVFRGFHCVNHQVESLWPVEPNGADEQAMERFYPVVAMRDAAARIAAHFRMGELMLYIMRTAWGPDGGEWSYRRRSGPGAADGLGPPSGVSGRTRQNSGSSFASMLSTPPEPGTPRQAPLRSNSSNAVPASAAPPTVGEVISAGSVAARLLCLTTTRVETVVVQKANNAGIGATTTASTSSKSAVPPYTLSWSPAYLTPHALLNFLIAPLAGDIFSLTALHEALGTMGISNKLLGLMHVAPLFCAHLARQSPEYLITDVLLKKLSTFPFQRWLRDSLLTFQDTLTAAQAAHAAAPAASSGSEDVRDGAVVASQEAQVVETASQTPGAGAHGVTGESGESDWLTALAAEVRHIGAAGDHAGDAAEKGAAEGVLPSYDDFIRHILRPAWLFAHQCSNLEAVMVFCAFVIETLGIVNDQVERRTYGAHTVRTTIATWETLLRQTRLVMLLKSRVGKDGIVASIPSTGAGVDVVKGRQKAAFTVANLSDGEISLHRLLAADTLSFAVRADQALEHEEKCRDVYAKSALLRRPSQLSTSASVVSGTSPDTHKSVLGGGGGGAAGSGGSATKSEVLLAWGPVADRRWKDLLAVAVAEDAIHAALQGEVPAIPAAAGGGSGGSAVKAALQQASPLPPSAASSVNAAEQAKRSEEQKRTLKRRRPLLLYFPMHGQSHLLGAYRTLILAERWSRALHRVDLLVCASQHLFPLPHSTWRAAVAAHIYMMHILPVVEVFVALEEDAQLLAVASAGGNLSALDNATIQRAGLSSLQIQQLLKLVGDVRLLKTFVNTAAELLGYIDLSLHSLQPTITGSGASAKAAAPAAGVTSLWDHVDVRDARYAQLQRRRRTPFDDETSPACWPPQDDAYLDHLLIRYAGDVSGSSRSKATPAGTASAATDRTTFGVLWTPLVVGEQVSMLWVLHLRSLCALRGVKPAEILGGDVMDRLYSLATRYAEGGAEDSKGNSSGGGSVSGAFNMRAHRSATVEANVQWEFLTQCLRQLVFTRQPTGAVYILAMRWIGLAQLAAAQTAARVTTSSGNNSVAPLTMDGVRLQHLSILLAAGGGSRDEEVEQMVPQIANLDLVLDTLIEALRRRMGQILCRIDQLPAYGPLIAAMDAEAVAWARGAVGVDGSGEPAGAGVGGGSSGKVGAAAPGGGGGAVDDDESGEGESDLVGICKSLNINIASTRHLIICVQSNLLNVPANLRRAPANAAEEAPALSDGYGGGAVTWFQRKTRCDALLALCKYFAQQFTSRH